MTKIVERAKDKQKRIIQLEGDLNGFRQTDEYLEMLINEEINASLAMVVYDSGACKAIEEMLEV